jgi:hypothetical protein
VRRILPSLGIIAAGIALTAMVFTTLRSLESRNAMMGQRSRRLKAISLGDQTAYMLLPLKK